MRQSQLASILGAESSISPPGVNKTSPKTEEFSPEEEVRIIL